MGNCGKRKSVGARKNWKHAKHGYTVSRTEPRWSSGTRRRHRTSSELLMVFARRTSLARKRQRDCSCVRVACFVIDNAFFLSPSVSLTRKRKLHDDKPRNEERRRKRDFKGSSTKTRGFTTNFHDEDSRGKSRVLATAASAIFISTSEA